MSSTSEDDCCSCSAHSLDSFDCNHRRNFDFLIDVNPFAWAGPEGDVDGLGPSVPLEIKKKVQAVDPNEGRCLITNATPDSGTKYTHCLPIHLSDDPDSIHRLEWYWGMKINELDLNSEGNIFPVSAQLSAMHDYPRNAPSWFLVPEDHIVDMFFSRITKLDVRRQPCEEHETAFYSNTWRGNLPELREKTYKYRLFPMYLRMEGMAITYIQHPPIHRPQVSDVTVAVYPFDNLPWVTSHLDPKFVIMEAGRKLDKMGGYRLKMGNPLFVEWFDEHPILRPLLLLYEAWSAPIPSEAYQDTGFVPPADTDPSSPSGVLDSGDAGLVAPSSLDPTKDNNGRGSLSIAEWSVDASTPAIFPDSLSGTGNQPET